MAPYIMAPTIAVTAKTRSLTSPAICGCKLIFTITETLENRKLIYGFNYINRTVASKHRDIMKRFYRPFGLDIEK
jgi:hypothetical protein